MHVNMPFYTSIWIVNQYLITLITVRSFYAFRRDGHRDSLGWAFLRTNAGQGFFLLLFLLFDMYAKNLTLL